MTLFKKKILSKCVKWRIIRQSNSELKFKRDDEKELFCTPDNRDLVNVVEYLLKC